MKATQDYFSCLAAVFGVVLVLVPASPGAARTAKTAIVVRHAATDPFLSGGPAGPCAPYQWSPDYIAGTDAYGHPVAPADLASDRGVHLLSDVVVPEVSSHSRYFGRTRVAVAVPGLSQTMQTDEACPKRRSNH